MRIAELVGRRAVGFKDGGSFRLRVVLSSTARIGRSIPDAAGYDHEDDGHWNWRLPRWLARYVLAA